MPRQRLEFLYEDLKLSDKDAIALAMPIARLHQYDLLCWGLIFTEADNVVMENKLKFRGRRARIILVKYSEATKVEYERLTKDLGWQHIR